MILFTSFMYSVSLVTLALVAHSGHALVFRLPTLNDNIYPGESNLIAWGDFGDATEVSVYLAHGTPSNYTILQTVGENIPMSTTSAMYHLPQTLPPTDVFFMLEGNDSPKSVATRSVYVDNTRGSFGTFPSISFPSGIFPSGFPFNQLPTSMPTSNPNPHPTPSNNAAGGLPVPAMVGIALGSLFFFFTVLMTVVIMKRRTVIKKRRALLQQQIGTPKPPPKWSEKPTDINVNVAIQGLQENQPADQQPQPQQHTEYNYNYQPEYNYNHEQEYNYNHQQEYNYNLEQQTDMSYTNQQSSYSSPGGFIVPSPKTAAPATSYCPQTPTHDNGLHDTSISPTAALHPPAPAYQMFASTKASATPGCEYKPNQTLPSDDVYHKPNATHPSDEPHSNPTVQKPHSRSPPS